MTTTEKIQALRQEMIRANIQACIVPSGDPHMSEYAAPRFHQRQWISGFTGSMGTVAVTNQDAALWVDGRYIVQAKEQVADAPIEVFLLGALGQPSLEQWLMSKLPQGGRVCESGMMVSAAEGMAFRRRLALNRLTLISDIDLINQIRPGIPALPDSSAWELPLEFAGRTIAQKVAALRLQMSGTGATHYIISSLDDIAWLFNLRGGDIDFFPVNYAFAMITPAGVQLFMNMSKLTAGAAAMLDEQGVTIDEYDRFLPQLDILPPDAVVALDPKRTALSVRERISCSVVEIEEYTRAMKCVKNPVEVERLKGAAVRDGVAMVRFLMALEHRLMEGETVTEGDIAVMLREQRAKGDHYIGESFRTIAAYGPHGAMMHYSAGDKGGSELAPEGLMVVDSGAQYKDGTTDITRTLVLGQPTPLEMHDFTLVLRSHIALASTRFLQGATGSNLDAIARRPLWDEGLDYRCGTGHGVGYVLHVHEDPCRFSQVPNTCVLKPNMVLTVEPGIYREGVHGIRTENMVLITEHERNEYGAFLKMEPLTWCPIDKSAIDASVLTQQELDWINDYHDQVYRTLSPHLNEDEQAWLQEATSPITVKGRHSAP